MMQTQPAHRRNLVRRSDVLAAQNLTPPAPTVRDQQIPVPLPPRPAVRPDPCWGWLTATLGVTLLGFALFGVGVAVGLNL